MPTLRLFCTRGPTDDFSPTPSSTLIFLSSFSSHSRFPSSSSSFSLLLRCFLPIFGSRATRLKRKFPPASRFLGKARRRRRVVQRRGKGGEREAAPSAIQSPPRRSGVVSSLSLSGRGPYHPRGRRTGRHRVKSDRAIISPLAAFEVYIPIEASSVTARRKEGKGGTRHWQNGQRVGGRRRKVPSLFHPPSLFLPFPLDVVATEKERSSEEGAGREARGTRWRGKCVQDRGAERCRGPH